MEILLQNQYQEVSSVQLIQFLVKYSSVEWINKMLFYNPILISNCWKICMGIIFLKKYEKSRKLFGFCGWKLKPMSRKKIIHAKNPTYFQEKSNFDSLHSRLYSVTWIHMMHLLRHSRTHGKYEMGWTRYNYRGYSIF